MLVWYGVRGPAGLCVVAAGRMFGHAWMALEPRGATSAECPGAVPGGDGGYLGGVPAGGRYLGRKPHTGHTKRGL